MSNYILFIEITSKIELKIEKLKCKKSGGDRRDEKVRELIEFIIHLLLFNALIFTHVFTLRFQLRNGMSVFFDKRF